MKKRKIVYVSKHGKYLDLSEYMQLPHWKRKEFRKKVIYEP
jgi:hypothetical protein